MKLDQYPDLYPLLRLHELNQKVKSKNAENSDKIEKLKVIYSGSPTHWHEGKKLLGDWGSGAWLEFIKKQTFDNKIDLILGQKY
jgi:hypothetical protein